MGYDQGVVRMCGDTSFLNILVAKNRSVFEDTMEILAGAERIFCPGLGWASRE